MSSPSLHISKVFVRSKANLLLAQKQITFRYCNWLVVWYYTQRSINPNSITKNVFISSQGYSNQRLYYIFKNHLKGAKKILKIFRASAILKSLNKRQKQNLEFYIFCLRGRRPRHFYATYTNGNSFKELQHWYFTWQLLHCCSKKKALRGGTS